MPHRSATDRGSATLASAVFEVDARHRAVDAFEVGGDLAPDVAAIEVIEPGTGEMIERGGKRRLPEGRALRRRLAVDQESSAKPGIFELARNRRRRRAWLRDTAKPSRRADGGRKQHVSSGSRPPCALAASSANIQPAIAPGTVSAASGPRVGIMSWPARDRARRRATPGAPAAISARTRPDGSRISQKPSPPIPFMCG